LQDTQLVQMCMQERRLCLHCIAQAWAVGQYSMSDSGISLA